MSVFVVGLNGCRLMPVSERKARLLLDGGKASVYRKVPFTIKLNYKTGSTTQPGYLGIDTGSQHIGVSVVREDGTVLHKEEVSLRDSMTKRKLLETKASLRRGRRYRKTRYRHPKWRPKTKRVYCEVPDKKGRHWKKQKGTFTQLIWMEVAPAQCFLRENFLIPLPMEKKEMMQTFCILEVTGNEKKINPCHAFCYGGFSEYGICR
jgi:hypothetical protein